MMRTEIIYEDADIFVCYKPAGFATQTASALQADLVSELKNYRKSRGESDYIGLIGRLDQPVEGLMVIAKNPRAAGKLEAAQAKGRIDKYYLALTQGLPKGPDCGQEADSLHRKGEWIFLENDMLPASRGKNGRLLAPEDKGTKNGHQPAPEDKGTKNGHQPAVKDKGAKKTRLPAPGTGEAKTACQLAPGTGEAKKACLLAPGIKGARKARLEYQILDHSKTKDGRALALLRVHLLTGRRHQIRLQLSGLGSPILGDARYGADPNGQPLALCACQLSFPHPGTGERISYEILPRGTAFGRFKNCLEEGSDGI
ncbi:RluA family pseudouridine synthase [Shuttleworthella satelles]|uniref:RNA pseudouridylate synthase n=1 Tax=Shuttleworthella satelles DSM 14600 TaxID=626523 RepID=C4GD18_9FIRM|nr:pseudouridine synthase [Shuttleworthia satelles]EEP27868.1 RNA pseudouridine synthase [Shuttleworthia satelles DSM 14600]